MSTRKPKYPSTPLGYFCFLHDNGADIFVNAVNNRIIQCKANSNGNEFRVDFILDKEYNNSEREIYKRLVAEQYTIVNVRMY